MNDISILTSLALAAASQGAIAQKLEPKAQAFAEAAADAQPIYTLPHSEARKVLSSIQAGPVASAASAIEDVVWPVGPTGEVRIRIVRPLNTTGLLPVILYLHGGGWVMGDRNTHDHLIRGLAAGTQAAVVFVEYDNAPEVQYPVNNEQAYAALEYVKQNAKALGFDGTKIAIAGDSAGGNMAIAVTLMAKERKGPPIKHQVLFYPVTADVSENATYTEFGEGPFLTRKAMDYFLDANFPSKHRNDVLAFPLNAESSELSGLPSATIIVAENDLLREEGEEYGRKLLKAGVSVTSTRYNGTMHDFVMLNPLAESQPAKAAIRQAVAELREAFAN